MNRLFPIWDRFFVGPPGRRTRAPLIHPIDAMMWLEWSLSNGIALAEENSPWEFLPGADMVPPGLYEPFRAGKLLRDYCDSPPYFKHLPFALYPTLMVPAANQSISNRIPEGADSYRQRP